MERVLIVSVPKEDVEQAFDVRLSMRQWAEIRRNIEGHVYETVMNRIEDAVEALAFV